MRDTEQTAIVTLAATPVLLRALIADVPEGIQTAVLDRDWSPRHLVAHLLDVERPAFRARLERMASGESPRFEAIDPIATMNASGYLQRPVAELLDEFERQRAENVDYVRSLGPNSMQLTGVHESGIQITVANLIHYWPVHDLAHVRHLQRMLAAVLSHEIGAAGDEDV